MLKPIPYHEGYFADTEGNIYSQWINKGKHGLVKGEDLIKIKGSKSKSGHITFRFGRNKKTLLAHRLIYETFNGEIPHGMVIRHLNDIPYDNRLVNLKIGTQKDNVRDAKLNKIFPIGSKNGQSKLTESDVTEIRALAETHTKTQLADKYNVSRQAIREAINKKTWKHVI